MVVSADDVRASHHNVNIGTSYIYEYTGSLKCINAVVKHHRWSARIANDHMCGFVVS